MAVPARRAPEFEPRRPHPRSRRGHVRVVPTPQSVRVRPRRRSRRAPFFLFSALLVAGMVILLASAQAIVAQGAFRLLELTERADRLEVETDHLRFRVAELSTPNRIAAAGRRAGLVPAQQVVALGEP